MKKTVLTSLLVAGALSTSVFAFGGGDCPRFEGKQDGKSECQMQEKRGGCERGEFQMGHHGMKKGGGDFGMRMFADLDLSDEQKYQLSILHDEMRLEMKKSMGMKQERPMEKFITKDGFDTEGFKKYMDEKHAKMGALRAEHMKKVVALLTKEQLAKLQASK